MSIQHIVLVNWSREGESGTSISESVTTTTEGEENKSFSVAPGTNAGERLINFDPTEVHSFYMVSDRDISVRFKDAPSGSAVETIALTANQPLVWYSSIGYAFTVIVPDAVEACDFTLSAGSNANVEIRFLEDQS